MAAKKLQIGERKPRDKSDARLAELRLRMRLNGTAPDLAARMRFFETVTGKKAKGKRKLVEKALLHRATKRCFRSIADQAGFLDRKTRHGIREIVQQLYAKGKISFSKGTKVDFSGTENKLGGLIGKRNAAVFMRYFSEYLRDEKNYLNSFLKGKRTLWMEKNW